MSDDDLAQLDLGADELTAAFDGAETFGVPSMEFTLSPDAPPSKSTDSVYDEDLVEDLSEFDETPQIDPKRVRKLALAPPPSHFC